MPVTIESDIWEPNQSLYVFIFTSCFLSLFFLPHLTKTNRTPNLFDHAVTPSLHRFQRSFLLLYSISSVMEGLSLVFGEYELAYYGVSREQMVLSSCVGYASALIFGTLLGMLSDLIGQKKICLTFCILHIFVGIWKRLVSHPCVWLASVCLSLTNSIYLFNFETWMVIEHDKLGHSKDTLSDMFWLMTFFDSASFIGSQMLANWLVGNNVEQHLVSPSTASVLLAVISLIVVSRGWKDSSQTAAFKDYSRSLYLCLIDDKRTWLLGWAQACVQFSIAVFWILWAPTIVADGREVHLGLIFPCLLGARMFGSTAFPWLVGGAFSVRTEDCLMYMFLIAGLLLSIVAYDYQEIGVLVALFCLFHACIGLILPSLARLRTLYVPNEMRGGMIGLSLAPANAAIMLCLVQGGYYRSIENSTIMAFAALGLLSAACCMHLLKQWGKQLHRKL